MIQFGNINFRPDSIEKDIRYGTTVRFNPAQGAYSPTSAQACRSGQTGIVVHVWSDDMVFVLFGNGGPIVCNTAYLSMVD